jgi:hypothetical protein
VAEGPATVLGVLAAAGVFDDAVEGDEFAYYQIAMAISLSGLRENCDPITT